MKMKTETKVLTIAKMPPDARPLNERYGCECNSCGDLKPLRDLKYLKGKMLCMKCFGAESA